MLSAEYAITALNVWIALGLFFSVIPSASLRDNVPVGIVWSYSHETSFVVILLDLSLSWITTVWVPSLALEAKTTVYAVLLAVSQSKAPDSKVVPSLALSLILSTPLRLSSKFEILIVLVLELVWAYPTVALQVGEVVSTVKLMCLYATLPTLLTALTCR